MAQKNSSTSGASRSTANKVGLAGRARRTVQTAVGSGRLKTSAQIAAAKRNLEKARTARVRRSIVSNARFAVKDAVTGVKTALSTAKKMRAAGRTWKDTVTMAKAAGKAAQGERNRKMAVAARKAPKNKGR